MTKSISKFIAISLFFAVFGMTFSILFQAMAYWDSHTIMWYWIGAILSYVFATISLFILLLIYLKTKNYTPMQQIIIPLNIVFILVTILWTTFIIIAGQSGI
ncbi:DUF3902 family protein [Microbacteriaceae bacterium 4G12]